MTAETRLVSFLDSSEFGPEARQGLLTVLPEVASVAEFKRLYRRLFSSIKYSDLPDLIVVADTQLEILKVMLSRLHVAETNLDIAKQAQAHNTTNAAAQVRAAQNVVDTQNGDIKRLNDALRMISGSIAEALRQRPPSANADLSFAELYDAHFSGLDFGAADLTGTWVNNCDLSGADLSRVQSYDRSEWGGTQWWLAKAIHPKLLQYLSDNDPFDPKGTYTGPQITRVQISRLTEFPTLKTLGRTQF